MAAGTARYFGFLAVGIGSMLAGAAVTHQVFKPKLDLRPLDAESQRKLEVHRAAVEAEKQAMLDAIDRGDAEEMQRLIKNRMPAGQSKFEQWVAQVEAEDKQRKSLFKSAAKE